ncbi:MAG: hypothetical protein PHH85_02075 [Candidatus Methanoperedens sp.]|nr:hypothetical protein [Candidatus Methanoperedens sp.]
MKPWYALSAMFFAFSVMFAYPVVHYDVLISGPLIEDAPYIVFNIRYYAFLLLASISVMAMGSCFIYGFLGKKDDGTD